LDGDQFPLSFRTIRVYQYSQQVGKGFTQELTITGLLNF